MAIILRYESSANAPLPDNGKKTMFIDLADGKLKTKDYLGNIVVIDPSASLVLSVNGQTGVVVLDKSDVGLDQVDNTSDINKPISTPTQDAFDDVYDTISALDKNDVGLGNVDNVADIDKPISNATQAALDGKVSFIQDNERPGFTIPSNHTAISGKIDLILNEKITIELNGRLALI